MFDSLKKIVPTIQEVAKSQKRLHAVAHKGKRMRDWGGGVVDVVLQFLPQPVQDHINLASEDVLCAYIANESYGDPFLRRRTIETYTLIEAYNGIDYCLYRDEKAQKYILGFRGTEVKEANDYLSDIHIVLGTQSFTDRFQESLHLYETIAATYPDDIKVITGHSLGGTICYMVAQQKDPDRTVVFNAGSSANPTFLLMMKDTQYQAPRTKRVFTYRILGDLVSALSVIGYTRTFRIPSVNPLDMHRMSNFLPQENS